MSQSSDGTQGAPCMVFVQNIASFALLIPDQRQHLRVRPTCSWLQKGLPVQEAIRLARLEDELQLQDWGYVEGGHDIDESDTKVRILAASVFMRLLERAR